MPVFSRMQAIYYQIGMKMYELRKLGWPNLGAPLPSPALDPCETRF